MAAHTDSNQTVTAPTPCETGNRSAGSGNSPFLEACGLVKQFGGVQALKDVDLDVFQGEVHGLVGANGAGKSTLIRILAGVHSPDGGTIFIDHQPVEITDPQHATRLGLSFIHQELNLVPKFSALQNMTLGLSKPARLGLIDWRAVRREVAQAAERVGIDFPLDTPVSELSVAEQWLIEISRALVRRARLIAMDEPTASLSAEESARLFQIIRELSDSGIAILYVSHRLDEILELCHRVTVFKDGRKVMTSSREEITKESLVRAIVGGELTGQVAADFCAGCGRTGDPGNAQPEPRGTGARRLFEPARRRGARLRRPGGRRSHRVGAPDLRRRPGRRRRGAA